jgi:hypothetical protein
MAINKRRRVYTRAHTKHNGYTLKSCREISHFSVQLKTNFSETFVSRLDVDPDDGGGGFTLNELQLSIGKSYLLRRY